MSKKATDRIALSLWEALADDGYLFVGQSETLRKRKDLFEPVRFPKWVRSMWPRLAAAPLVGMFEPLYLPLDLPFIWFSREQVWKVMDGPIGQELLKKMEARGVKGYGFGGGWGFRHMQPNKRAIYTPDDMKGQTIRVQESPIYIGMMKQLGANPVPMPWGEVYLAMKQGTVDGMESPTSASSPASTPR